jgi:hypothetical protein
LSFCQFCGGETNAASETCPTCGRSIGAPNVRLAATSEMKGALENRYIEAMARARARGAEDQAQELEHVALSTSAVISMSLSGFREFLEKESALYSTYQMQVRSSIRQASAPEDDRMRLAVDATVHGSYGERITYAALSADGLGVASYGVVSMQLRDIAVSERATVLESNSWNFVQSRNLFGKLLPPGFLSVWSERHKLVCAKLADMITPATLSSDLVSLILTQAPKSQDEEFLEVHIYGTFNSASLESVSGSSKSTKPLEIAMFSWVKDKLAAVGKPWVER